MILNDTKTIKIQAITHNDGVLKFNIFLLVLALALILTYVYYSNTLASKQYRLDLLKNQSTKINSSYDLISSITDKQYDIKFLNDFATKAGMIEDKNLSSVTLSTSADALVSKAGN